MLAPGDPRAPENNSPLVPWSLGHNTWPSQ